MSRKENDKVRSNKGITLTSLVIYIIVLMIVIGLFSNLSGYFYKNLNLMTLREKDSEQFLRLTSFISKDTNSNNIILIKVDTSSSKQYLIFKFKNGDIHQYICSENNLYFLNINSNGQVTKKIKLCNRVSGNNIFSLNNNQIDLNITINEKNYTSSFNVNI